MFYLIFAVAFVYVISTHNDKTNVDEQVMQSGKIEELKWVDELIESL